MSMKIKRGVRWIKVVIILILLSMLAIAGSVVYAHNYYNRNLKPVSQEQSLVEVTIKSGATLKEISKQLKQKNLIRSSQVFEQYIRNNGTAEDIKAGVYELSPSYGVPEIVSILTKGKVINRLVTILPGARLDQVKKMLTNSGYSEAEVVKALDPKNYFEHPALVDKPREATLEGYLYPESFKRNSETTAEDIVSLSLDEMQKRLTPDIRQAFTKQGLTTHQAVTLASIVEREVSKPEERKQVAQVFLTRLKKGIKLQSDATSSYGAVLDGQLDKLTHAQILVYESPYNTYLVDGLPPGPISNVSESSLLAVAYPADTNWLYFVSGDDGVTYFSKTLEEHESLVNQHCKKNCQL